MVTGRRDKNCSLLFEAIVRQHLPTATNFGQAITFTHFRAEIILPHDIYYRMLGSLGVDGGILSSNLDSRCMEDLLPQVSCNTIPI